MLISLLAAAGPPAGRADGGEANARAEPGDLVLIALPGTGGRAISETTTSPVSHLGIVALHPTGARTVVHSLGMVREEPLARFLARGEGPHALIRYPFSSTRLQDRFVAKARSFLGVLYDREYRIDNDTLYCSELVYRAFADGPGLVPVPLAPMHFGNLSPGSRQFWERFFQGRIPEGHPGISPGDYYDSPAFTRVHDGFGRR